MRFLNTKLTKLFLIILTLLATVLGAFFFNKESEHFVLSCEIFNQNLELLFHYPGKNCEFYSDGSVMIAESKQITYYDSHMQIVWREPLMVHHSLQTAEDESKTFMVINEFKPYEGRLTRFDVIKIIETKTGKELSSWSSFDHREELLNLVQWKYKKEQHLIPWIRKAENVPVDYEFFHFNSIYKIGKNAKEALLPYLKATNFIVNTGLGPVLYFDEKLNLIHHQLLYNSTRILLHDIQIDSDGNLLLYWNQVPQTKAGKLEIVELPSMKSRWSFERNPELPLFASRRFGSLQKLTNGNILFSDITNGGRVLEIRPDGKTVRDFYYPEIDPETKKPVQIFKAKKRDLTKFLKNHTSY